MERRRKLWTLCEASIWLCRRAECQSSPHISQIKVIFVTRYGLLGPSGCGKTSLLRCIVGRLHPNEGSIKVFGKTPGEPGSKVPGASIGYMPQELALFPDFTIEETLSYFSRLYHLKDKVIGERIAFLLKFLDLPDKTRLVGNLSGGQKRRVSLAASLVHNPPLLILDGNLFF